MKYPFMAICAICSLLIGCAASTHPPTTSLEPISKITLPAGLRETSGLYCLNDSFLTINDSGNLPLIHTFDKQGQISHSLRVRHPNSDWEAITLDGDTLLVADIGNNRGKRTDLALIPVNRSSAKTLPAIPLGYKENNVGQNLPYAHDFDAEAMTVADDMVFLFSKSWASHIANVYRFSLGDDVSALSPYATVEGLPGVITGADWDTQRQQFVVVGYLSDPFGNFDAFIARLSDDFTPLDIWPIADFKQVEGICVCSQGDYWITQEAGDGEPAILAGFTLITP